MLFNVCNCCAHRSVKLVGQGFRQRRLFPKGFDTVVVFLSEAAVGPHNAANGAPESLGNLALMVALPWAVFES